MKWFIVEQQKKIKDYNYIGPFSSKQKATKARNTEFSTMINKLTIMSAPQLLAIIEKCPLTRGVAHAHSVT